MGKHNQSAALGRISDFSESPPVPPDDIEMRLANLERAVNEILFQLADLSERLDQPRMDQVSRTPPLQQSKPQTKKPKPKQLQPKAVQKPKSTPTPTPQPDPLSEEQVATLAGHIYELLTDGAPRPKAEICKTLGCSKSEYAQAREHLIETERMLGGDANEMVAGKICNVPGGLAIWTQELIDAELQRRKPAASDDNTQGDTNA